MPFSIVQFTMLTTVMLMKTFFKRLFISSNSIHKSAYSTKSCLLEFNHMTENTLVNIAFITSC